MSRRDVQREPVIQAVGLDVVHGDACHQDGSEAMIGTGHTPGHVSDDRPSPRRMGCYPRPMKHLAYVLLLGAAACGTDNVDAAGNYTAAITNKDNGCNFQNWQVGNQSTGIAVTITQSSNNATASVSGVAGAYLDVVFEASPDPRS